MTIGFRNGNKWCSNHSTKNLRKFPAFSSLLFPYLVRIGKCSKISKKEGRFPFGQKFQFKFRYRTFPLACGTVSSRISGKEENLVRFIQIFKHFLQGSCMLFAPGVSGIFVRRSLKGSHFVDTIILRFSRKLSQEISHNSPPSRKFQKFWSNGKPLP